MGGPEGGKPRVYYGRVITQEADLIEFEHITKKEADQLGRPKKTRPAS
jgi:hypothetical protein